MLCYVDVCGAGMLHGVPGVSKDKGIRKGVRYPGVYLRDIPSSRHYPLFPALTSPPGINLSEQVYSSQNRCIPLRTDETPTNR